MELMTASGEIIYCSRHDNKDIFLAALCNLGAVGIILSLTWQCESAYRLHQECESLKLEEVQYESIHPSNKQINYIVPYCIKPL